MYQEFYQGSRLLIWPLVGLLLFVGSFVAVLLHVIVGLRSRARTERLAGLPLDSGDERLVTAGAATPGDAEGKVS